MKGWDFSLMRGVEHIAYFKANVSCQLAPNFFRLLVMNEMYVNYCLIDIFLLELILKYSLPQPQIK